MTYPDLRPHLLKLLRRRTGEESDEYGRALLSLVNRALMGDQDIAEFLLVIYVVSEVGGAEIPPELGLYVADCLAELLAGEKAERAFNLEKPPHWPKQSRRMLGQALAVGYLYEKEIANFPSVEQRVEAVAETLDCSDSTVWRALKRYRAHFGKFLTTDYWSEKDRLVALLEPPVKQ